PDSYEAGAASDAAPCRAVPTDAGRAVVASQRPAWRSSDGRPWPAGALSGGPDRRGGPPDRGQRSRRMKMLLAGLVLLVTFPPLVGSAAATIATAPHLTPAVRLFPWVPAGGYPDRFPYGSCTWWA